MPASAGSLPNPNPSGTYSFTASYSHHHAMRDSLSSVCRGVNTTTPFVIECVQMRRCFIAQAIFVVSRAEIARAGTRWRLRPAWGGEQPSTRVLVPKLVISTSGITHARGILMSFGCVYMGGLLLPSESVCAQCELELQEPTRVGHRALCPCALSCGPPTRPWDSLSTVCRGVNTTTPGDSALSL